MRVLLVQDCRVIEGFPNLHRSDELMHLHAIMFNNVNLLSAGNRVLRHLYYIILYNNDQVISPRGRSLLTLLTQDGG